MPAGYSDTLARLEHFFRSKCQTSGDDLDEGEVEMVEEMLAEAYSASQTAVDDGDVVVNEQFEEALESPFGSQVEFSQGGSQGYNPVEALKKYREHYAKDIRLPPVQQEKRAAAQEIPTPKPELISTMTSQEVFSTALHRLEAEEQLKRERRERDRLVQVEAPKEELISHTEPPKVPVKMVTKTANAIMNILGGTAANSEKTEVVETSRPHHHTFKPAIPETITIPTVVVTPLEDTRLPSVMATPLKAAHIDLTDDKEPEPEPVRKPAVFNNSHNPPFVFDGYVGSESAAKRTRTFNKPMEEPESPLAIREPPRAPVAFDMPKIEVSVTPLAPAVPVVQLSPQGFAIKFTIGY